MELSYLALGAEEKNTKMSVINILILTKKISNRSMSPFQIRVHCGIQIYMPAEDKDTLFIVQQPS